MNPLLGVLRGLRGAVRLRRKVRGPLRPSWTATFETLAEVFHQGSRRIIRLPLAAQRRATEGMVARLPIAQLHRAVAFENVRAGGVPAEWGRRKDSEDRVLLYFHGGGYGLGSVGTHRDLVARLGRAARADTLSVEYRLAPEHRFPAQLDDALSVYQWLLSKGIASERIVVAGDSAGGGLTLSLLLALRDRQLPLPRAAVCLSPWVDLEATGASMKPNERFDYISRRAILQYARRFADAEDWRNPLAAPLHADFSRLPPLLIQAGTAEVLLDDSVRLAERARTAGVDVRLQLWPDMIHVWHLFAFLSPKAADAIEAIGQFMRDQTPIAAIEEAS